MAKEKIYITKTLSDGSIRKPMIYDKDKFDKNRQVLMRDGWRGATEAEISRFYTIEETPTPPKAKSKEKSTPKTTEEK